MKNYQYYVLYKPFGLTTQFSGEEENLSNLSFSFPKDIYPVGRLDKDSEGLLILTNDSNLQHRLTDPKFGHHRTYAVQVEGEITDVALKLLEQGVEITLPNKKKYKTLPAFATIIESPNLPERNPPIRVRKTIPDSWIELTLTEGKNRQVRKMTAKVGFPTLRLIRVKIEQLNLKDFHSEEIKEYSQIEIYKLLNLS
jgi:23S rRNA pseudouridine2457 synthase